MEINTYWTNEAKIDILKIYKFYNAIASSEVAEKIISQFFVEVRKLNFRFEIGQKETLLAHLNLGHRYLLSGHFKIIYKVSDNTIFITHVFDTRQNPIKLK